MSVKSDLKLLLDARKPRTVLRCVYDEGEITTEPGVIWVLIVM